MTLMNWVVFTLPMGAPFLNSRANVIVVFDQLQKDPAPIQEFPELR